jgi:Zn-dependent alcohol dehydrogenase
MNEILTNLHRCRKIIGVDRVESRLKTAKELGATDVIDGSKLGDKTLVEVSGHCYLLLPCADRCVHRSSRPSERSQMVLAQRLRLRPLVSQR